MAAARVAATALQYSKRMSKFICWVWAIYRFGVLFASALQPAAAEPLVATLINLDWIMLVNAGTYLINSLGEKYIFSDKFILRWIDKGGFKNLMMRLGNLRNAIETQEEQAEDEEEYGGEEDGDDQNG